MSGIDWFPFWLSLKVAVTATVAAAAAGVALAFALAEGRFAGRSVVESLTALPLTLPPTVLGYFLLVALGRGTAIGRAIESVTGSPLVFTWQGAVVAAAIPALPYVVRTARAAFEEVDPAIREASYLDGASRLQQFVFVFLPLARGGIGAGIGLAFARALGEFGTTLMVAGNIPGRTQTMPLAIYDAVLSGRTSQAGVLSVILAGVAVAALVLVRRLGGRP